MIEDLVHYFWGNKDRKYMTENSRYLMLSLILNLSLYFKKLNFVLYIPLYDCQLILKLNLKT